MCAVFVFQGLFKRLKQHGFEKWLLSLKSRGKLYLFLAPLKNDYMGGSLYI